MPLEGGLLRDWAISLWAKDWSSLLEVRNLALLCQTLSTCLRVSEAQR